MIRARRAVLAAIAVMLLGGALPVVVAGSGDPVLLVHGFRGDPSTWADMAAHLRADGRTVEAIDLPGEDNVANAAAIRDLVVARGWARVDLVGQSMGGLSARQYAKFVDRARVDAYVSIGTPQYGILSACLLPQRLGGQMCPSSRFLRDLNRGDDTPGTIAWTTIYSTDDEIVPNESSRLDGGACFVEVSGPDHNSMDNDAVVMAAVAAAIDRDCPGEVR